MGSQKLDLFGFPGRDAGDGEDAGVKIGVEVEECGKVGREIGDASQKADPGGDALTDEGKSGPAGEAKEAGRGLEGWRRHPVGDIRGFRRGSRG